MIILLLAASLALAADIDRAPSGSIVTVRPGPTERAAIVLSATSQNVPLPADTPSPMWLVNPAAWRLAVACGVERADLQTAFSAQQEALQGCQGSLDAASSAQARCTDLANACIGQRDALEARARQAEEKLARARRKQVTLTAIAAGAGVVLGAGGVVVAAFAL